MAQPDNKVGRSMGVLSFSQEQAQQELEKQEHNKAVLSNHEVSKQDQFVESKQSIDTCSFSLNSDLNTQANTNSSAININSINTNSDIQDPAPFMLRAKKGMRSCAFAVGMGLLGTALVSACTSPDVIEHEVLVKDPVSFKVDGLEGELLSNVEAHLGAMAVISKKRVRYYVREIEEVTTKALRAYGYYHPEIKVDLPEPKNKDDLLVKVHVDQGKPLYIRNCVVEVLGEGVKYKVFQDILKNSPLKSYGILNHGQYETLKSDIHSAALSYGFFDGKFTSKRILVYQDQNFADIELIYDSGRRYQFGDLVMDEETQKLYLPSKTLQNFHQGDKFTTKRLNNFVSSLNQTGYYNSVDVRPDVEAAQDYKVPLRMHLERRSNNNVRVGLGYSTDEGTRLLLEWNKPLLNDRGDSLATLFTLTQKTQEAQAVYKIPYGNPLTDYFTVNASQLHWDINDTLSDRSQLALHYIDNDIGVWRRDYFTRLEYEDYDQGGELGTSWNLMPGITLTRRESSGGFDPVRGYSLSFTAMGGSAQVSDLNFVQLKATYKGQIELNKGSRFLFRVEQGANLGPDADLVPPTLRFFAGGDSSIRGFNFRERSTRHPNGSLKGAKYLTTGTAEYQFPFGVASSRLAVFLDAGTATDDYSDKSILYGPGIGYRFISPYGIVRVDLAVGIEKGHDNSYQLHFAFGPEF